MDIEIALEGARYLLAGALCTFLVTACVATLTKEDMAHSTYCVDSTFTAEERMAILEAGDFWRSWTHGNVEPTFAWNCDSTSVRPSILRVTHENPEIAGFEKSKPAGWVTFGLASGDGTIRIVIDRAPPESLPVVTAHEMGHLMGFAHDHAPGQVMSESWSRAAEWGEEDVTQCVHLGFCEGCGP
jgi:hypothetical protein